MIEQVIKKYDFSSVKWKTAEDTAILDPVFIVKFNAVPSELQEGILLQGPGLKLVVENKTQKDYKDLYFNRNLQNYFSLRSADGSCLVMEASLLQECDWVPWKIGFPLTLVKEFDQPHEFALLYDGVHFNILCDGEVIDREAPEEKNLVHAPWGRITAFSKAVREVAFTNDLKDVRRYEERIKRDIPIAYYTPYGFNTWIGDVVTFAWKGLFHIFYLHDRRHHQSRRGKGAHEFWHMTSSDLKNWVDHGPVLELNAPWQSTGTGNAFVYQDKLHLAFGWHTERAKPMRMMADQLFHMNLSRSGHTGEFTYDQLGQLTPSGASYLSCEDGIHFTPSNKLIHYLRNPSVFPQKDGKIHVYHVGKWESDHLGSFRLIDKDFPRSGKNSFARNCLDCPNTFSLEDWEYFMVGFTGFYGRKQGSEEWIDFTEKGWEPYDGACVPMAVEFNTRVIEGSWPDGNGWGSCLLLRELISLGDGRIGKRWIDETLPEFGDAQCVSETITLEEGRIYTLIEFEVAPAGGPVCAVFEGAEGEGIVEFTLDVSQGRAQWSAERNRHLLTCREKMLKNPELNSFRQYQDLHCFSRDYAKEELLLPDDGPFTVRMLICRDPKFDSTLIDTEIAGRYTMLTHRNDLHTGMVTLSGVEKITLRQGNK